jgi:electron transfer flavoprotein-quinone oxidoreductase
MPLVTSVEMSMSEQFDAVVVGAGPAGITAALVLARAGLSVALFERGEEPGQKNLFGGVLHYSRALNELILKFWREAPVERYVKKYTTTFLTNNASLSFSFEDNESTQSPYDGFTLLRAKFDRWYAQKAQDAGVFLVTDTLVDDLVWKDKKVIGVKTAGRDGIIYADTVIAADGVNSLLARKARLRRDFTSSNLSVAAKEILSLPRKTIEERFDLTGNEGSAHLFLGACTQGLEGGAFLYTNRASLSLGVVAKLKALQEKRISIADLLEIFKGHPFIKKAIKDSTLKEYSGHLIPEGGIHMMPRVYGNGILLAGDAASFVSSTGLTLQGMDFAIESGFLAAEAVKQCKQRGDFSAKALSYYKRLLGRSLVLQNLKSFRHMPHFLSNPRIYDLYPSIACGVAKRLYRVDGRPRKKIMGLIKEEAEGKVSGWRLIKDIIQGGRALIWP